MSVGSTEVLPTGGAGFWRLVRYPLLVFGVTRGVLVLLVWASLVIQPAPNGLATWHAFPDNLALDGWVRWDAAWYDDIANFGYVDPSQIRLNEQRNTAFFPGYPLLIRGVDKLVGQSSISGLIVSSVCFLAALVALFSLVRRRWGEDVARRTVTLLAVSPFSLFFTAVYTESTFLLAVVLAFVFADQRRWALAGICAAVAGATRVMGFLVLIGLGLVALEQAAYRVRALQPKVAWLALALVGPAAFMVYLNARYGRPFDFVSAQYVSGWAGTHGFIAFNVGDPWHWVHAAVVVGSVALCWFAGARLPHAYLAWSGAMIVGSLSKWDSMGRLLVVVFPLFVCVALLVRRPWPYRALAGAGAVALGYCAIRFAHWGWVA